MTEFFGIFTVDELVNKLDELYFCINSLVIDFVSFISFDIDSIIVNFFFLNSSLSSLRIK